MHLLCLINLSDCRSMKISFADYRTSICTTIHAPPETVWDIVTDTRLWPEWGPSLQKVVCADRTILHGSKGRLKTVFNVWLPFSITQYTHISYWSWRVGGVEATGHRITRNRDNSSTLCFEMAWWFFPYLLVCRLALKRIDKLAADISASDPHIRRKQ